MDDRTTRRTGLPLGVSRRSSCLYSVDLNHETKANHYPMRIGGSTRVMAVKSNRLEDKEQRQASSTGGRLSNGKSVAIKSASPAPKVRSSSPSSLRKTHRTQQTSVMPGQWNMTQNASLGLNEVGQDESAFQRGLEHGPSSSSSSRLGLSEISNLTAPEGLNSSFDYLQEVPTSSSGRSFFHRNSSMERREPRMLSGRPLNRQGSWNGSDILNVNSRLSDIVYDNEQQCTWTGMEDNGTMNLGLDPSIRSASSTCMNDAASQSNIFGTGDHDNMSEDSLFTVASITEDLYDMDVSSRNDSVLPSSALVNQRAQEQGSLRRAMTGHGASSPVSVGEVVTISRSSAYKRKTSTTRIASQGTSKSTSQDIFNVGPGSRERHVGRSIVGASTSRHNIGNFGCTSASDALASNYSSASDRDFEKTGNRRPDLVRRVIDGQDPARGRRLSKVSAASNSDGTLSQRNIRSGAGIATHHQNLKTSLPPPRASRRTTRATQSDTWCSRGLLAADAAVGSEIPSESSSSSMRVAMIGHGLGGSSPPSIRGRSAAGTLQRRNNVSFGAACALGERVANRFVGSTTRGASNSVASCHLGSAGSGGRLHRACADSDTVSHSLLSKDDIHNNISMTSAPAPSRPPPVSALSVSSQLYGSAVAPVSLSFSGHVPARAPSAALSSPISMSFASTVDTSSPNLFDGSVFGRSTLGGDGPYERSVSSHSEAVGRRAFHSLSIESESPSRYAMEGLAEVLLALEQIEQDEELTYEQVLMLEANLLFGGINMHDQHSDMRLDIDNMSYEELLALEERMGNVSTGLAEDAVSKCLTKCFYSSDMLASSNTEESEVKCSVCQEEYEERDELGRLKCDHSYHAACIRQWLLQKNQCPICKAPASI